MHVEIYVEYLASFRQYTLNEFSSSNGEREFHGISRRARFDDALSRTIYRRAYVRGW